ncbi:MAG: 50S ribosomal protein L5 [Candidatus Methanospirareceae archaeon]
MAKEDNPMRRIEIDKVVINMGVGEGGMRLANAEKILNIISGQKPVRTIAKKTIQSFGIKKGEPIGCKVTLRGKKADEFLKKTFKIQNKLLAMQFSENGNFSFGIPSHIDLGIPYDPKIGIFGMDVSVSLKRPGYRIKERRIQKRKLPRKQRISKEEGIEFIKKRYGVEVIEEIE